FPRGISDAGRRGHAGRRALCLRGRLGTSRTGPPTRAAQGAAALRVRAPHATELQIAMRITLHVWRQKSANQRGRMVQYQARDVNPEMSFLEMLDVVNEDLTLQGEDPIAFDSDCREGICGMCGFMINGVAHGPRRGTTVCQLHMRKFKDGDVLYLEPWRARAVPVIKDLIVDRSAVGRIIAAGGFMSLPAGSAQDGNVILVPKRNADLAMDAAACIGCGACVAACPNAAAALFTGAKISHLGLLPQGRPERYQRVLNMVTQVKREMFGSCTNIGECEAVCPKDIRLEVIARMNRDFLFANWTTRGETARVDE